jgi:hypothetical protein
MQQAQLRTIAQEQEAGVQNRQRIDNAVGALVHPPGSSGNRSMAIEAINARVASQSGHIIARERQTGVINQNIPLPQQPQARLPAAIAPDMVMNNVQRGQRQVEDDPFISAVLRVQESIASAAAAPTAPPATNFKVQQEARGIELQNLMQQHKFISALPENYPNKERILQDIINRIIGTEDVTINCPVCQDSFTSAGLTFVATLPCCNQRIHTNCLLQLSQQPRVRGCILCPMCRHDLCDRCV